MNSLTKTFTGVKKIITAILFFPLLAAVSCRQDVDKKLTESKISTEVKKKANLNLIESETTREIKK